MTKIVRFIYSTILILAVGFIAFRNGSLDIASMLLTGVVYVCGMIMGVAIES